MSPEIKARIFEPFYTTKEVGKGTGLGLATVFGIVQQHAGFIEVDTEEGRGTTFNILLPPTSKTPESKTEIIKEQVLKRGEGQTILLVEDEPILRELAHAILEDAGYKVLDAEDSQGAFDVWEQHAEKIDLLLTDMVLPGGMSGRELALELQQRKPSLKVIYSTGYSQEKLESQTEPDHFLQKPYPPETLTRAVQSCLDVAGSIDSVATA
jgi:CheY-like chemotaxis protein